MKHERDHEKEQMAVSSYFVDQDEDINATYGFEDEHQLYQALNMRNEHGQFCNEYWCHQHFGSTLSG